MRWLLLLVGLMGLSCVHGLKNIRSQKAELSYEEILTEIERLKYDPTTVDDLIRSDGYDIENHEVTTSDGYILTLHRIPVGKSGKSNGKVAFLQHGVLASSADWVINGNDKALAYILSEAGYDVWMGNARGNTQSHRHTSLDPSSHDFWKFSWHEIGTIDLPTMIDYVLNYTQVDGVYYAGHSQGTTSFYVMTSSLPEYNDKIKVQVSLAPIAYMNHMTSPLIQIIALWSKPLEALTNLIGMDEFLPSSDFVSSLGASLCKDGSVSQLLCTNALFAICGFSPNEMNSTLLPILMQFTPAGAATRQMLHYGQEVVSAKFRRYDFGLVQNLAEYGKTSPPKYDLGKITAPVYLIYSRNDWLSAEKDVAKLKKELGNCQGALLLSDYSFNHLDYTYGIHAPDLVYNKVVSLFGRH